MIETDDLDENPAADDVDPAEPAPEPAAPNITSLSPSSLGCTVYLAGDTTELTAAPGDPMRATGVRTEPVPSYEVPFTDVPAAETDPDLSGLADLIRRLGTRNRSVSGFGLGRGSPRTGRATPLTG